MADKIQLRADTAANWTSNNPVLRYKEPGIEFPDDYAPGDQVKMKIGDGETAWNDLAYFGGTGTGIADLELDPVTATFDGVSVPLTAGENLVKGNVCYMFAGKMYKGDADAVSSSFCFAIATDTIASNAVGAFLLIGIIGGFVGLSIGAVYLSVTPGALSQTLVSGSNDVVQILGIAISATHIYFKPELVQIELL